ncbi:hypothetical protein HPB48_011205 [Haemaphysalis longicornis]|uniref:Uncharacterized protein n=1 Tax=Haemaphysalis longicornis TaxID=44386 RepID=A0A9J6FI92_HAELO|nr:hypothetical protein HPB48_011205 [Haemaphysalis longicornis]
MARSLQVTSQRIAEKLTILNDRGVGMLTRIYNIKKACGDAKSKPSFLSDKNLESAIKHVVRRFPNIDIRGNSVTVSSVNIRQDIMKLLSLYYYTFVDLLDFRDHVNELLTTIDSFQLHLDITVNFDATKAYLDLVAAVEDRKAVLACFNTAHEMTHGHSDNSFPSLGQLIVEYDPPLKKLADEFVPHSKTLFQALLSLQQVFPRRNLTADEWRKSQMLSLLVTPAQMLTPAQTETMPCEYLSLETMERWIILGFLLLHPYLQQPPAQSLFLQALSNGWALTLFRDELLAVHPYAQQFFEGLKGHGKRASEVKEALAHALSSAPLVHRERRKFLRSALKELALVLAEQPGLLGPKALYVLMGLSLARDEVCWLVRHNELGPPSRAPGRSRSLQGEDLLDRQLPELLFHMEELRALFRKYSQVVQLYYVQYLNGFDAPALETALQGIPGIPEEGRGAPLGGLLHCPRPGAQQSRAPRPKRAAAGLVRLQLHSERPAATVEPARAAAPGLPHEHPRVPHQDGRLPRPAARRDLRPLHLLCAAGRNGGPPVAVVRRLHGSGVERPRTRGRPCSHEGDGVLAHCSDVGDARGRIGQVARDLVGLGRRGPILLPAPRTFHQAVSRGR